MNERKITTPTHHERALGSRKINGWVCVVRVWKARREHVQWMGGCREGLGNAARFIMSEPKVTTIHTHNERAHGSYKINGWARAS